MSYSSTESLAKAYYFILLYMITTKRDVLQIDLKSIKIFFCCCLKLTICKEYPV